MWDRLFEDCEPTDAFVCRDKEPPCGFITLKDKKENVDKAFEKNSKHIHRSQYLSSHEIVRLACGDHTVDAV